MRACLIVVGMILLTLYDLILMFVVFSNEIDMQKEE